MAALIWARPGLLFGRLLGNAGLSRSVPCARVASCVFPGSLVHFQGYVVVSLSFGCSGQAPLAFRLAARSPVYSRTCPVNTCRRPCRFLSVAAPSWARSALLFGRLLGGPVCSRADPVYFRIGHAGLSWGVPSVRVASRLFPGSAEFTRHRLLFAWPPRVQFIPGRVRFIFVAGRPGFSRRLP